MNVYRRIKRKGVGKSKGVHPADTILSKFFHFRRRSDFGVSGDSQCDSTPEHSQLVKQITRSRKREREGGEKSAWFCLKPTCGE